MVCVVYSCALSGLNGFLVEVEADINRGLPRFDIVGLPDTSVKESGDRVHAAIKNQGYEYPLGRITVNLAPGELKKEGPIYDLPILVSLLSASGQFPKIPDDAVMLGELSLDGRLRRANGVLSMARHAKKVGMKQIFVPAENAAEAAMVEGLDVYGVADIRALHMHFTGEKPIEKTPKTAFSPLFLEELDFADVLGQDNAKRALTIAAAGGHHTLMIGPPGSGKSMMAKRLPSIMPPLTEEEALSCTEIFSVAGELSEAVVRSRPVRTPHHTVSRNGLTGGGTNPRPGEISMAHNGILFLDELPEFQRETLEALRQPIEEGKVTISRVSATVTYPCNFMLVCAMNPCKCGFFGHPTKHCNCSEKQIRDYRRRISGPLLDRIDLHVNVMPVAVSDLEKREKGESSAAIRARVLAAREIQKNRYKDCGITLNSQLTPAMMNEYCKLDEGGQKLIRSAFSKLGLSARGYDRILKVSRTIADLDGSEEIKASHIAEAIQYRILDRE